MITSDAFDYKKSLLFPRAIQLLQEYDAKTYKDIVIDTIEDYFKYIKVLADIEEGKKALPTERYVDPIFTILPGDEGLFKINANTRKIDIPAHFKTYGVGVQGDEVAEILYFSIARYFDAVDLADMDIVIQWNRGDTDLNEYYDRPYKRSVDYDPGNIVFGWPVSEEMTKETGNITFSVRFFKFNNESLVYSLSTEPTIIKIVPGLDFKFDQDKYNKASNYANQIYNNLRDGESQLTPVYQIAAPNFVSYFTHASDNIEDEFTDVINHSEQYHLPCQFKVHANLSAEDILSNKRKGRAIRYQWYRKDLSEVVTDYEGEFIYEKITTPLTELLNNEHYYYKDGEDYLLYDRSNGEQELYLKHSVATPKAPGSYYVKAINEYNGSKVETESLFMNIAYPENPVLQENYQDAMASVVVRKPHHEALTLNLMAPEEEQPLGYAAQEFEYSWYYNAEHPVDTWIPIVGKNSTIEAVSEGYYQLDVINTHNGGAAAVRSSNIEVRYEPSPISISLEALTEKMFKINAEYGEANGQGELEYVVLKKNSENDQYEPIDSGFEVKTSNEKQWICEFDDNANGIYRWVIRNTYYNKSVEETSADIVIE